MNAPINKPSPPISRSDSQIREVAGFSISGWIYIVVTAVILLIIHNVMGSIDQDPRSAMISGIAFALAAFGFAGLFIVGPNEAKVLQLFGNYQGTVRAPGLRWTVPLFTKRSVSVKIRNFESPKLKVNDLSGNPIEIAAIIVWRVVDTAEALFQIESFEDYIRVQSEAAIRNLAMQYSYDSHDGVEKSLHGSPLEVSQDLKNEVQLRLDSAGVEVLETRLSHLAYAPEIAATMLQRQQASAIIGARQKIVEGAVGMVEMALEKLSQKKIVELDEERKAAMVSNLLVVLCGEKSTQPIINAGTLY
jgi:regulator of protease activity HflC (stomatin/prohibitin superfamily)